MGQRSLATLGVFTGLLILMFTELSTSSAERGRRQLPCNHPLRIARPSLFTFCDSVCTYTAWGPWRKVPSSVAAVPTIQCPSGKTYSERRTRTGTGNGCSEPSLQTRNICLPTQEERLILALGLGGSGNNYRPVGPAGPPPPPPPPLIHTIISVKPGKPTIATPTLVRKKRQSFQCPQYGTSNKICHNLSENGKRSAGRDKIEISKVDIVRNDLDPIPFDWYEHGPNLRSRRQASCDDQIQHVLFVLDTSGSIGSTQFKRMKKAIGTLPSLFCRQVQFAVVTYNHYINLEFCFNCYENTYHGRTQVTDAITAIPYRGGGTHTAATAKCVCDKLIQPACGIAPNPNCLDVVFITDGKSNDPQLEICDEISCLHDHLGIDTYAIGINSGSGFTPSYNRAELECIANFGDLTSAFEFESFTAFEKAIENIVLRLLTALPTSPESCARLNGKISPIGAVPLG